MARHNGSFSKAIAPRPMSRRQHHPLRVNSGRSDVQCDVCGAKNRRRRSEAGSSAQLVRIASPGAGVAKNVSSHHGLFVASSTATPIGFRSGELSGPRRRSSGNQKSCRAPVLKTGSLIYEPCQQRPVVDDGVDIACPQGLEGVLRGNESHRPDAQLHEHIFGGGAAHSSYADRRQVGDFAHRALSFLTVNAEVCPR